MDYFKIVKRYYEYIKMDGNRMYSKEQVSRFVVLGKLTKDDYREIVGEEFDKPVELPAEIIKNDVI